ncbi:VOC family protein [Falsiphaeobacter marinintestinus]|uniref:VOC family protein n=1 Tax=Falsiphaeobacter marinintestinus TaxID=1492905 RepID=UPI0011B52F8E|nr:VOC family protein [Phaeobacter marinintestinus]
MNLDHVAVAGTVLADAVEAVEVALGVKMQPGGQHDVFFTHNRLLGLADGLYLEAIAIDPAAPNPDRPRWFDLDRFEGSARLTNWICRSGDLAAELKGLPVDAGQPVALQRGDLLWQMAVPQSGILPFDNMFPALIEWQTDRHPAQMLAPTGCALRRLIVSHPDAAGLSAVLSDRLADGRVVIEPGPAGAMAEFDTPHGRRLLR